MAAAARTMKVAHRPVNLSAGIRVIAGVYHVQNVNAYDSRLKDWLRRFKGVATCSGGAPEEFSLDPARHSTGHPSDRVGQIEAGTFALRQ